MPARIKGRWLLGGVVLLIGATIVALIVGPADIDRSAAVIEAADFVLPIDIDSGLNQQQATIVRDLRLPRIVLGLLVGAMLSIAGGAYQGAFRNPLADPYLLGVAAGAGFGGNSGNRARLG